MLFVVCSVSKPKKTVVNTTGPEEYILVQYFSFPCICSTIFLSGPRGLQSSLETSTTTRVYYTMHAHQRGSPQRLSIAKQVREPKHYPRDTKVSHVTGATGGYVGRYTRTKQETLLECKGLWRMVYAMLVIRIRSPLNNPIPYCHSYNVAR